MRRFVALHVCAECGESHCGCPDPLQENTGVKDGYYTLDKISSRASDIGFGVTEDDIDHIKNGTCKGNGPWPAVIGTGFVDI
jgi:hypothetical protein